MGSVMTTVLASNQPTRSRSNAVSHQKNTTAAVCNGGGATCTTCIAQRWEQKQQNRKYPRNQDPINVFRTNLASTRRRLPRTRSNGGETRTRSNAISYQDNAYRKDLKNVRTRRRLPRSRSNAIDETSSLYPCADCGKVNLTRNAYESYNDADRIFGGDEDRITEFRQNICYNGKPHQVYNRRYDRNSPYFDDALFANYDSD